MSREKINLGKQTICDIICDNQAEKDGIKYTLAQDEITHSDPEDGGADHEAVFKRESDGKYFKVYYSDWDMMHNFDRDFPDSATEVHAKTIEVVVFE